VVVAVGVSVGDCFTTVSFVRSLAMQLHHEKLDVYQVAIEFLGFAFESISRKETGNSTLKINRNFTR